MCPERPNQKADRPVSTAPLSGIGVGCTTSYVEIRSLATIRIRSPRSYISRTFTLAMSGRSVTGGTDRRLPMRSGGSPPGYGWTATPIPLLVILAVIAVAAWLAYVASTRRRVERERARERL